MDVLVINLPHVSERRIFQEKQLSHLGLDFEIIDAFHSDHADQLRNKAYWNTYQRPLRNSEKACFLSHRKCWELVADQNKPLLILEDDALLSAKVPQLLNEVSEVKDIDVLNLETRGRRIFVGKPHDKISQIRQLILNRDGAAAYLLWPQGAKKLLTSTEHMSGIADAILWGCFELNAFQTDPALAIQSDRTQNFGLPHYLDTNSSIVKLPNEPSVEQEPFISKLKFRSRRFCAQLKLALRQIQLPGNIKKKSLTIDPEEFSHLQDIQA